MAQGLAFVTASHVVNTKTGCKVVVGITFELLFNLGSLNIEVYIFAIVYNQSVRHFDEASASGFYNRCATVIIISQLSEQSEGEVVSFVFSILASLLGVLQLSLQTLVLSLDSFKFLVVVLSNGDIVLLFPVLSISVEGLKMLTFQNHREEALRILPS